MGRYANLGMTYCFYANLNNYDVSCYVKFLSDLSLWHKGSFFRLNPILCKRSFLSIIIIIMFVSLL